jgi:radical SAM protein with 4Fe4S-binding SPASM domain
MSKEEYIKQLKIKGLEKTYETKLEAMKTHELQQIFLEVTLRCNAKCEHCGSSCGEKIQKDEVSAEDLKRMLKDVANHYDARKILLDVTGGEPLMRKDLFDLMAYANKLGFRWGITTNGMLINDKILKKFKECNVESISISLDGLKETHEKFRKVPGCYNIIIDNIKKILKTKACKLLQITTVANKKNLNELQEIYELLLSLGIKSWRVVTVDPIGRAKKNDGILLDNDEFKYVLDFIREKRQEGKMQVDYGCSHYLGLKYELEVRDYYFYCGAGVFVASILSNGDIYVCPNVERRKELVQGNIRTDNFVEVWENKFKEYRSERKTEKCSKCKKCKSFKYCKGDSFHTFNFDDKKPNICMKEILGSDFTE